jgi:hypothetical protein
LRNRDRPDVIGGSLAHVSHAALHLDFAPVARQMRIRTAVVAIAGGAGLLAMATPAEAASAIQIYRV